MKKICAIVVLFTVLLAPVFAVTGETSLIAGMGSYDGDGNTLPSATFNNPADIVFSAAAAFIADTANNVIRKIDLSTGVISTLAGNGVPGFNDGIGAAAGFNAPNSICIDASGNTLYVADSANYRIRAINVNTAEVYTVAGSGIRGVADGIGSTATFYYPFGIAISQAGDYLYVSEYTAHKIRRFNINTTIVDTLAGSIAGYVNGTGTAARFNLPAGMDINTAGTELFIADVQNYCIRKLELGTLVVSAVAGNTATASYREGIGSSAYFNRPYDVSLDNASGLLYVADTYNYRTRAIDIISRQTYAVAGSGLTGDLTGNSYSSRFSLPMGLDYRPLNQSVYVADTQNGKIKMIDTTAGNYVSRYAGMFSYDGDGNVIPYASFYNPADTAINTQNGRIYIADAANNVIRMIDEAGIVSTIAGSGVAGYAEGIGTAAQFYQPQSVALDPVENKLYVSDTFNNRIRVIDLATNTTSLVAGGNPMPFYAEGIGSAARFNNQQQISIDYIGKRLFVADTGNNRIRIINLVTNEVYLLAGSGIAGYSEGTYNAAAFNQPEGIVYETAFNGCLVADTMNNTIRRVDAANANTYYITGSYSNPGSTDGNLSTAKFNRPVRLAFDYITFMLYVSDSVNDKVRYVQLWTGGQVGTLAGSGTVGYAEGIGPAALFGSTRGMSMDVPGQKIYIADGGNNRIRRIDAFRATSTVTLTPTYSITKTPTLGGTVTVTQTVTETLTNSPVVSPTVTPTITETATASGTRTITLTLTVTQTASDTATRTPTATITETHTVSYTATVTQTPSCTATATFTRTVSETATVSVTGTATVTGTQTYTETVTQTATLTVTASATFTQTCTGTQTHTDTETPTISVTFTGTGTVSLTPSASETGTETETATVTPVYSESVTPTLTGTPTITRSATETATATPQFSATISATVTATPSVTRTPIDYFERPVTINDFFIHPNPSMGKLSMYYDVSGDVSEMEISVFTVSARLVWKKKFTVAAGADSILCEDFKIFGAGIYHVSVKCRNTGGYTAHRVAEMVIIK